MVIGGGFIGAEVASTAYALGLDVTVVEAAPTPLAGPLGATMGDVVSALHVDHGVRLLCGVGVKGLSGERRVDAVLLEDGRSIPGDIVVVGVGARPCVEWLEGSGVELENGVKCGADGRTSLAGVVAVGDCANWYDPARVPTAASNTGPGRASVPTPRSPHCWRAARWNRVCPGRRTSGPTSTA